MKRGTVVFCKNQLAQKVFVLGIFLDNLVAAHGFQDLMSGNVPAVEAHVNMVGPQYATAPDTLLDECHWVIGHLEMRSQTAS